jgi:hypothetical protein
MLAAYYEGKQVAMHLLSYYKNTMTVNKHHYRKLIVKQSFDTENTLLHHNAKTIDFKPLNIDLGVYDA